MTNGKAGGQDGRTAKGYHSFDDDSEGYDLRERDFVRANLFPGFEWLTFETPSPRNRLAKPLSEARIGLISTAGGHLLGERPMGPGGTVRPLRVDATELVLSHEGYDTQRAMQDTETVFPGRTLLSMASAGQIGSVAPLAVSTMGYIPEGRRVLDRTVPAAYDLLRNQDVDLALLVPA